MGYSDAPRVVIAADRFDLHSDEPGTVVVHTPLDLIRALDSIASISMAILADHFAREAEVASFLRETYPKLRLLTLPQHATRAG